jgi:hypothetical protein
VSEKEGGGEEGKLGCAIYSITSMNITLIKIAINLTYMARLQIMNIQNVHV